LYVTIFYDICPGIIELFTPAPLPPETKISHPPPKDYEAAFGALQSSMGFGGDVPVPNPQKTGKAKVKHQGSSSWSKQEPRRSRGDEDLANKSSKTQPVEDISSEADTRSSKKKGAFRRFIGRLFPGR